MYGMDGKLEAGIAAQGAADRCGAAGGERPRVLVVEDQYLVARQVERVLAEQGCEVVGPARSLADARGHLSRNGLAGAVLDFRLDHATTAGIARELLAGTRPLLFITADAESVPADLEASERLEKPFSSDELTRAVARLVARIRQRDKEA
jgi:DNA-binding response OmpR family regulator